MYTIETECSSSGKMWNIIYIQKSDCYIVSTVYTNENDAKMICDMFKNKKN